MHTRPKPSLREVQQAVRDTMVASEAGAAARYIIADGVAPEQRLAVYRNTFESTIANALRLSYPAVRKLVGAEFFEGTARLFAHERPPRASCLDLYGADFAEFLAAFEPARSLPYLADVARLEWAVNGALHAPDVEPLDASRLASIDAGSHERIRFILDPSVSIVRVDYPADAIWRSVLADDDDALAAIVLADGPVHLLVQRLPLGVEVIRIDASAFKVTEALLAGHPLGVALTGADTSTAAALLADHLAAGRFVGFAISRGPDEAHVSETPG